MAYDYDVNDDDAVYSNLLLLSDKLSQLTRNLNNDGISVATSLQYNRTEYDLQYKLILADLSCPGIETILVQVRICL